MSKSQNTTPDELYQQLLSTQAEQQQSLPPVEKWNPPVSGDIDIIIARDGRWFHEGGEITRSALRKLFASILVRENDDYYLVTPVEKWRIKVEDAPLVVVAMEVESPGPNQVLVMTTSTDDRVAVGKENPLWVSIDDASDEPSPYVRVRRNLNALINRNVFYQLVDLAEEREQEGRQSVGLWSMGEFFTLGEDA